MVNFEEVFIFSGWTYKSFATLVLKPIGVSKKDRKQLKRFLGE